MSIRHLKQSITAASLMLIGASPAYAVDSIRQSVLWAATLKPGPATGSSGRLYVRCDAGKSLVALGVNHTDRMVGYWYQCAGNASDGTWDKSSILTYFGKGKV